ncbi:hypothetical protein V8E54_004472 [Elaphomyces granulatus]
MCKTAQEVTARGHGVLHESQASSAAAKPDQSLNLREDREHAAETLQTIFLLTKAERNLFGIDDVFLNALGITCEGLQYDEKDDYSESLYPYFFTPLSLDQLRAWPIDMKDRVTRESIERSKRSWSDYSVGSLHIAATQADTVVLPHFSQYKRRIRKDYSTRLRSLTQWLPKDFSDTILDDDFVDTVFYSLKFHPTDMWLDHQGRPHVMFCLEHDCESDERLLPGELLAIVAIMLTRLRHPSFKSHSIIPVMCFSFIKKMRGRILQAHFDKNGLIIRKSQIYDFTKPETAQPLVEIFLQFMTCKLVGDTKTALLR